MQNGRLAEAPWSSEGSLCSAALERIARPDGTIRHMTNNVYKGSCHCGNIAVVMELARAPDSYSPRACDCDFCRKHGALILSDPSGRLEIELEPEADVSRYRQGSDNAECLVCADCGVWVGACYEENGHVYAAINIRVFGDIKAFAPETVVSPRMLDPYDKIERWKELWFADVSIHGRREM